jgi:hypothetical protein
VHNSDRDARALAGDAAADFEGVLTCGLNGFARTMHLLCLSDEDADLAGRDLLGRQRPDERRHRRYLRILFG